MRKLLMNFASLLLIVLVLTAFESKAQLNKLTRKEKKDGWELLFDGKTTKGWKKFKGDKVRGWKVIDGILYNSGGGSDHGGDIITTESFKDFELYLEWKIDAGSNSGVFYHAQELDDINAIYESAPEYQLLDDEGHLKLIDNPSSGFKRYQMTGANYAMDTPQNAQVMPIGEWNKTRIIVKGPHVEHWLNGVKVVEYELWSDEWYQHKNEGKWKKCPHYGMAKEGHIGLQDHGGLTCFRNMKIRKL